MARSMSSKEGNAFATPIAKRQVIKRIAPKAMPKKKRGK